MHASLTGKDPGNSTACWEWVEDNHKGKFSSGNQWNSANVANSMLNALGAMECCYGMVGPLTSVREPRLGSSHVLPDISPRQD